jgi:L-ascorbate metabolism protein UlaG (beta-lactamase superfamily)
MKVTFTQIDTACMRIDLGGFVILTDPAFDQAGSSYLSGTGRTLNKTGAPAVAPSELGPVDLVLLSHDQHKDNLDNAGREFIRTVPLVISTSEARERLGQDNVVGLTEWESVAVKSAALPGLRITATPARHGTTDALHAAMGHVLGFIIEWEGQENGVLYISGDTVLFDGVYEVGRRFNIHTAVLHVGNAGFTEVMGNEHLTFNTAEAIEAAKALRVRKFIPTHMEGWTHFRESAQYTEEQVREAGLGPELVALLPGVPMTVGI